MILTIQDFQKAYPYLWNAINEARLQSGSNKIDEEYSPYFSIPIRMPDASLADNCLAKKETILGQAKLNKIIEIVKSEPNMWRWSDLLYYPNNPRGLYSDRYKANKTKTHKKKEDNKMSRVNIITGEIIATVETEADAFIAKNRETGEDVTESIGNQKKLKYAFDNSGVLRGRTKEDGSIVWRVVKEKFVKPDEPATDETA